MTDSRELGGLEPPSAISQRLMRWVFATALLASVAGSFWLLGMRAAFPVGFWGDDATYVATARSLAEGTGYRHIQLPGEPLQTRYPPLYPALLSGGFVWGEAFPANLSRLLLPGAVAASGLWFMSLVYWRRVFQAPALLLWCAGALAIASPVVLAFVRYTMSDLVYGAFALGALLCLDSRNASASSRRNRALLVAGAVLIALSMLTRAVGIALLPAAVIALLANGPRRQWREASLLLAIVLLACGPWWLWQAQAASQNGAAQSAFMTAPDLSYGLWLPEQVTQIVEVLRQNSLRILFSLVNYQLALPLSSVGAALVTPSWRSALLFVVAIAAFGLCGVGFVASLRRHVTAWHIHFVLYIGLIWLWPFEPHRFLVPWTHFILFFLLRGVWAAALWMPVPSLPVEGSWGLQRVSVMAVTLLLGAFFLLEDWAITSGDPDRPFVRELAGRLDAAELGEVYAFLDRELANDAVIASATPGGVYLHSGRRGYFLWPDANPYERYYGSDRTAWNFYTARSASEAQAIQQEIATDFTTVYGDLGIHYYLDQPNWLEAEVMGDIARHHPGRFEELFASSRGSYRLYRMHALGPPEPARRAVRAVHASGDRAGANPAALRSADDTRPNIVLITIESLRTDHVGFLGGMNDTTPVLDALAAESTVYPDAHSVTSWTLASHASLFTGLYPPAHQAVGPAGTLDESHLTTAEILSRSGYQTAGVVSGPYLRTTHKLDQGFEFYDESITAPAQLSAHEDVTNPAMLESLAGFLAKQRDPSRPLFLFAYFWDPHYDYKPPPPYDERFRTPGDHPTDLSGYEESAALQPTASKAERAYVLSQYDGEIAATDATLGRFFELLRSQGLWDDTAIFVTADHGEEFLDHGKKGHKNNLFAESVHVPLLVKYPRARDAHSKGSDSVAAGGHRDGRLVSLVDVHPTILSLAQIATGDETRGHGHSLLAAPQADRAIYFDLKYVWFDPDPESKRPVTRRDWQGVRRGNYKLLNVTSAEGPYLFDVASDPREQRNLARLGAHAAQRERLMRDLRDWRRAMKAESNDRQRGGAAELDDAERARLRALGYLGD